MRVPQFLAEQHVRFDTVLHPPAYTAQKLAHRLHIPGRQVIKCVLLAGPGTHYLAVLPATCQVDTAALAHALGGPVRLAGPQEMAELFRDCEWGVAVPFGTLYGLPTLLEAGLAPETWIVFEAHSHAVSIRIRCADFERLEKPRRLPFALPRPPRGPLAPPLRNGE